LDFVVLGEGEKKIFDLVKALRAGHSLADVNGIVYLAEDRSVRNIHGYRIPDVESIREPAWDLIPIENYLANGLGFGTSRGRSMPILASRGCPYLCTFCSSPSMWTTRYRSRQPAEVVAEMTKYVEMYGAKNSDFYDLTAIVKKSWIMEFRTLLIESGMKIGWQLP
jgi:radical SAM superfamily enzyme YgiQ (UPF0313 family)